VGLKNYWKMKKNIKKYRHFKSRQKVQNLSSIFSIQQMKVDRKINKEKIIIHHPKSDFLLDNKEGIKIKGQALLLFRILWKHRLVHLKSELLQIEEDVSLKLDSQFRHQKAYRRNQHLMRLEILLFKITCMFSWANNK